MDYDFQVNLLILLPQWEKKVSYLFLLSNITQSNWTTVIEFYRTLSFRSYIDKWKIYRLTNTYNGKIAIDRNDTANCRQVLVECSIGYSFGWRITLMEYGVRKLYKVALIYCWFVGRTFFFISVDWLADFLPLAKLGL